MAKKIARLPAKSKTALKKIITVKNADGDPDTTATIVIQNKIKYTPKVSVIIPVYNVEQYLRECLDSVVNQTLREIEIICVDDGSTDSSLDILKEYASKDNRITVIKQQNLHAGVARNAGLAVARGEYLSFLDSDDFFELNMLEKLVDNITAFNSDIALCKCSLYKEDTKEILEKELDYSLNLNLLPTNGYFIPKKVAGRLFNICQGFPWDKLFRKSFIEKNGRKFQNLMNTNDAYFSFTSLTMAKKVSFIKDRLIFKRHKHGTSLTDGRNKHPDCFVYAIDAIERDLKHHKIYDLYKNSFWEWALSLCLIQLKTLSDDAKKHLFSILHNKFNSGWECIDNSNINSGRSRGLRYIKANNEFPTINIAYSTNKKFLNLCLVSMASVLKNSTYENINFILLHTELTDEDIQKINELNTIRKFNLITYHVDNNQFKDYPLVWTTQETWYRCILPKEFTDMDKILYLDVDTVVRKSLLDLWSIDLGKNLIAAVEDVSNSLDNSEHLKLKQKFYFNAGVLLLNAKEWRAQKLFEKITNYVKTNEVFQADQGTLNVITDGAKVKLMPEYNYMNVWWRTNTLQYTDKYKEAYEKCDPTIVHYTGTKPNNAKCENIYKNDFYMYASLVSNYEKLFPLDVVCQIDKYNPQATRKNNATLIKNTQIPVVFASDENYLKYTYVTMLSCILNTKAMIDFFIMIPKDLQSRYLTKILQLQDMYPNCKVNIIKIGDTFTDCKLKISHITTPTYYRLAMAQLLPDYYDKCIYLDADVIVNGDIKEYYNIDLTNYYIAGVKAAAYHFSRHYAEGIQLPSISTYINAGVTLWNLKAIREHNKTPELIQLSKKGYQSQDQDVINVAFYGKIKILPLRYNLMTKYQGLFNHSLPQYQQLCGVYEEQDIKESTKDFLIVHYADKIKPWDDKTSVLADMWYKYAHIADKYIDILKPEKSVIWAYVLFPYYLIAMVFMKYIKMPVLKFVKHTKQIWYSHSHRGKMDMLNKNFTNIMQSVTSVKNDMTNQITQIKNQQSNLEKQIADLRHTTGVKSNDLSQQIADFQSSASQSNDALAQKIIDLNTVTENKSNDLSQQIADFQSSASQNNDDLVQKIIDLINTTKDIPDTIAQHVSEQIKAIQNDVDILNQQNKETQSNLVNKADEIKKHADALTTLNSEPYWAHIYHDTTANTTWLKNKSVSPGRWAISYIVLYVLYRILDEVKPKSILECGLGQSSKLTIQYADSHNADLTICENNPEWLSFFQRQFPTADKYTTILDTEMVNIVPEHESRTYANFKPTIGNKKFNLVLIDGPLGSPHYSRPEILDIVDNLDKSFVILLDDMNRIGEQEIWQLLKQKLHSKGIEFKERKYSSDKTVGLICSTDLAYLTSL